MAGENKPETLVLLESTEFCEVCCVQGYEHLLLFVRDCIIKEGKSSEKVDGIIFSLLPGGRAVLTVMGKQE